MKLRAEVLRQLEDPALEPDDRARQRIQLSKKFEEIGDSKLHDRHWEICGRVWVCVPALTN